MCWSSLLQEDSLCLTGSGGAGPRAGGAGVSAGRDRETTTGLTEEDSDYYPITSFGRTVPGNLPLFRYSAVFTGKVFISHLSSFLLVPSSPSCSFPPWFASPARRLASARASTGVARTAARAAVHRTRGCSNRRRGHWRYTLQWNWSPTARQPRLSHADA